MQIRSQETINQIKTAAVEMFSHSGYDAASVADICTAAGVSKGAFYHHFLSKQALFLAIMEDWLQELDANLYANMSPDRKVPEIIQEMGNTLGFVFKAASGQLPMFIEFLIQASRDEDVWKAVIAPYRKYQDSFSKLIDQGVKEGSFKKETNSDGTAMVLISLAVGILLQGVLDPGAADWNSVTTNGVGMILDALKKGEK